MGLGGLTLVPHWVVPLRSAKTSAWSRTCTHGGLFVAYLADLVSHRWRTLNHGKELKKGAWSVEEQNRLAELVARFQAEAPPPGSGKAVRCAVSSRTQHALTR